MPGKYLFFLLFLLPLIGTGRHISDISQAEYDRLVAMPDSEAKVDSLLELAKNCWYENPLQAIEIGTYGLELSKQGNYRQKMADALNVIGAGYYFHEQLDSAIIYFNQSLDLSYALEYNEGVARVTNNLGLIHDYLGNYDMAIEYYYKSLELEQETYNSEGIASSYLNIGNIYVYLEEYDKALEFMTNSLRLYQEAKNEDGILRCFTNIGSIYSDIGIPENALSYSQKALDLSRAMNNPDLEAANLNNIGEIYFETKDYSKSIEYYNLALEIEKEFADHWSEANTIRNIGSVYFAQKKYSQAKKKFEDALDIAHEIGSKILLRELYFDIYRLYETLESYDKALNYHILYTSLNDSIFGEAKRTEINRIESSNKMKYKDQQLELIRKENELKNLTIKNQRYALYITASLILLVLSFISILYHRARISKKSRKLLEKTNNVISDQKELLEQTIVRLKESEEKYKALAHSVQDGLIIVQDWKLVYVNNVVRTILGYDETDEIRNVKIDDFIAIDDLARVQRNYENRIEGKEIPTNYNIHIIHKSGKSFEVTIQVKMINLQGRPAIIGTIKDLSMLRAHERELITAKERAEKATLSKSLFLAGMSHEIRNHLNGIIGIADVLGETKLNKDQKDYVNIIKNSGDLLSGIINDILDLSRIEAGQIKLEEQEFSPEQILNDVISLHQLQAGKLGLKLKTAMVGTIPDHLIGDPNRLSQVLINLLNNALKFTDKGSISITVEAVTASADEVELKFSVKDTGIGISKESLDKLFKPFSQTHSANDRKPVGSGLGLVICKNLVNLMQGEIRVNSEPEKGSEFWFTARFKPTSRIKTKINGKARAPIKSNRILIVEDNVLNQQLTTSILSKEGYKADIAGNGKEGLDLFMKAFYNVILMDIQMPVMDGLEATSRIREYEAINYSEKSVIIAITAHAKEGDRQKLMDAGLDYYLQKPFKPDELITIIRNLNN